MLKRLSIAVLAAALFAGTGSVAILATSAPAMADQDDHHGHKAHPHANRGVNPYGANGYWANGAWHNRVASTNPGRHYGVYKHPKPKKHHKGNHDRD